MLLPASCIHPAASSCSIIPGPHAFKCNIEKQEIIIEVNKGYMVVHCIMVNAVDQAELRSSEIMDCFVVWNTGGLVC
jgi:hypothetical protein